MFTCRLRISNEFNLAACFLKCSTRPRTLFTFLHVFIYEYICECRLNRTIKMLCCGCDNAILHELSRLTRSTLIRRKNESSATYALHCQNIILISSQSWDKRKDCLYIFGSTSSRSSNVVDTENENTQIK